MFFVERYRDSNTNLCDSDQRKRSCNTMLYSTAYQAKSEEITLASVRNSTYSLNIFIIYLI
jgi:hypothetical protein